MGRLLHQAIFLTIAESKTRGHADWVGWHKREEFSYYCTRPLLFDPHRRSFTPFHLDNPDTSVSLNRRGRTQEPTSEIKLRRRSIHRLVLHCWGELSLRVSGWERRRWQRWRCDDSSQNGTCLRASFSSQKLLSHPSNYPPTPSFDFFVNMSGQTQQWGDGPGGAAKFCQGDKGAGNQLLCLLSDPFSQTVGQSLLQVLENLTAQLTHKR